MPKLIRIDWTEYERGFGTRPDGTTLHLSRARAEAYCADYWKKTKERQGPVAPHEYSAPGDLQLIEVSGDLYDKVQSAENGVIWWSMRTHPPDSDALKGETRDIPWGSHQFVFARPLTKDWSELDGTTMKVGREEFRPVKISGVGDGQRIYVIGSAYGYAVDQFEIGADIAQPYGAL